MYKSAKWYPYFRFSNWNFVCISSLPIFATMSHKIHPPWYDHCNIIWWALDTMRSLLRSFLHYPVTSSLWGPNIPLSTLFSNTLNLCSSRSDPFKTTGKIVVLCYLVFTPIAWSLTDKQTNFIKQSLWEVSSRSRNQNISGILWNPMVHYRIHKSQPPVPALGQMNTTHTFKSYFSNIHSNILPSTTGFSDWSVPFRNHLSHVCYMPRPSHPHWLHYTNSTDEAPHYAVFYSLPPLPPFWVQIFSLATCFQGQAMFFPWCGGPSFTPIQKNV